MVAPADRWLGIAENRYSPGLREMVCRLSLNEAFVPASTNLKRMVQVTLSSFAIRSIVEAQGKYILAQQASGTFPVWFTAKDCTDKTMITGVDGVMVDMSFHKPEDSEMPAWRIDGAVILAECTEPTMKEISQMGIPYVVINGPCPDDGSSVVPDDVGGTETAVKCLHELGHTRIAYSGPLPPYLAGHSSLQDRHDTYLSEMEKRGLSPIFSSQDALDSVEDYLKEIVFEKKATAILAYGHMGALNLLQAAHSLEIAIPEKLSIMCFCDEHANKVMSPGMTFIDLGSEKMGKVAAELLLKQMKYPGNTEPGKVTLQEKLVIRNSTASPDGN